MIRSPMFGFIAAFIMFVAGGLCFYAAVRGGILIGVVGGALNWIAGALFLYRAVRQSNAS